ncbi:hypothetical protein ES708_30907 [subsurface metagenome]
MGWSASMSKYFTGAMRGSNIAPKSPPIADDPAMVESIAPISCFGSSISSNIGFRKSGIALCFFSSLTSDPNTVLPEVSTLTKTPTAKFMSLSSNQSVTPLTARLKNPSKVLPNLAPRVSPLKVSGSILDFSVSGLYHGGRGIFIFHLPICL